MSVGFVCQVFQVFEMSEIFEGSWRPAPETPLSHLRPFGPPCRTALRDYLIGQARKNEALTDAVAATMAQLQECRDELAENARMLHVIASWLPSEPSPEAATSTEPNVLTVPDAGDDEARESEHSNDYAHCEEKYNEEARSQQASNADSSTAAASSRPRVFFQARESDRQSLPSSPELPRSTSSPRSPSRPRDSPYESADARRE